MILLALNVVFPLFFIMAVGYLTRRTGIVDNQGVGVVNRLLYWVFLPVLLFMSVYTTDLGEVFNVPVIVYSVVGTFVIFVISFFLLPKIGTKRDQCGVIVQALVRGNEVYYGFPVVIALIGQDYLGVMSVVVAFAAIEYNILSIIALEYFKGEKVNVGALVRNVVTNPMILATLLGVFMVTISLPLPAVVLKGMDSLSQVATPFALFLLGASFTFASSKGYMKQVIWVTLFRLIFIPAVVVATTLWMGFDSYEIVILFVTFGVPTAVASYSMARELKADYELASQIVFYTSIVSILTMFIWTIVLQILGIV
jgi:predicted permease